MGDTLIEWATKTLNIATGCEKVSAGCANCYITSTMPFRTAGREFVHPHGGSPSDPGATTGVLLHPERIRQPLSWRDPERVFVCSLADWCHEAIPDWMLAEMFAVAALTPRHVYQFTTKRPARARSLLRSSAFRRLVHEKGTQIIESPTRRRGQLRGNDWRPVPGAARTDPVRWESPTWPLPNVWLGVSTEDQKTADLRIPILLDTPAAVRWISAEPLLGPLSIRRYLTRDGDCPTCNGEGSVLVPGGGRQCPDCGYDDRGGLLGLDWVVAGGETKAGARPSHPAWFASLRDQCRAAGVAFFFKQWGDWAPANHVSEGPAVHITGRTDVPLTDPGWNVVRRVGKKTAGRLLDGRTWDEYPDGVKA